VVVPYTAIPPNMPAVMRNVVVTDSPVYTSSTNDSVIPVSTE
jgi:hypothetical protein